jgi:ABC-type phosphonate transport system ATPase subunit
VLELRGLTRRYGDVLALDDVSFTVGEGQMFGFIGPNGAGKTTAMRIILGVLEPNGGEVRWRGRLMDDEIRRRVGYIPEPSTTPGPGRAAGRAGYLRAGPRAGCRLARAAWAAGSGWGGRRAGGVGRPDGRLGRLRPGGGALLLGLRAETRNDSLIWPR